MRCSKRGVSKRITKRIYKELLKITTIVIDLNRPGNVLILIRDFKLLIEIFIVKD